MLELSGGQQSATPPVESVIMITGYKDKSRW